MATSDPSRRVSQATTVVALWVACCGCSDGPTLAPVAGVVTLDGQPVEGARVVTQPIAESGGSPGSFGVTDAAGRYELREIKTNQPGAVIGHHRVRVTKTERTYGDDSVDVPAAVRRVLPPNAASGDITLEVQAGGGDDYDIALSAS